MATAQGLKRTLILPIIAGGLALATIGGYSYINRSAEATRVQNPALIEVKPAPSLEERLTPVAVETATPQAVIPQKPDSVDINMFVSDFNQIKPLVEYISFQLGYPLSPNQEIIFLPKEEFEPLYMEKTKSDRAGPAFTEFKIRNNELVGISYVRQDALYEIIGPVFHELGQYNVSNQNKKNGKSDNSAGVSRETAAYAFHSAGISKLEEEFGLDGLFVYTKAQNNHVINVLKSLRKSYFENGSQPDGAFFAYWMVALKEQQLSYISEELKANKRLSSKSEMGIFNFLTQQNNQYIRAMVSGMTEEDFQTIATIITSRATDLQKYPLKTTSGSWEYYLTKSVHQPQPHQNL